MNSLEDAVKMVEKMMDALDEVNEAVKSTPPGPDSPEQIAEKLGKSLGSTLDPMTPLAPTPEQADAEADNQVLTRTKKLGSIIEEKLTKAEGAI